MTETESDDFLENISLCSTFSLEVADALYFKADKIANFHPSVTLGKELRLAYGLADVAHAILSDEEFPKTNGISERELLMKDKAGDLVSETLVSESTDSFTSIDDCLQETKRNFHPFQVYSANDEIKFETSHGKPFSGAQHKVRRLFSKLLPKHGEQVRSSQEIRKEKEDENLQLISSTKCSENPEGFEELVPTVCVKHQMQRHRLCHRYEDETAKRETSTESQKDSDADQKSNICEFLKAIKRILPETSVGRKKLPNNERCKASCSAEPVLAEVEGWSIKGQPTVAEESRATVSSSSVVSEADTEIVGKPRRQRYVPNYLKNYAKRRRRKFYRGKFFRAFGRRIWIRLRKLSVLRSIRRKFPTHYGAMPEK